MGMEKTAAVGAGGLVVGLLLGLMFGGGGGDVDEVRQALSAEVGNVQGQVTALDAKVAELGAKLDGVSTAVGDAASASSGQLQALTSSLDGVKSDLTGALGGISEKVSTAMAGNLDSLRAEVAKLMPARAGGGGEAAGGDGGDGTATGTSIAIATVADFDDKLRVFVSGIDPEGKTARVALNGTALTTLTLDEPVEANGCSVTLTGFAENGAVIDASC